MDDWRVATVEEKSEIVDKYVRRERPFAIGLGIFDLVLILLLIKNFQMGFDFFSIIVGIFLGAIFCITAKTLYNYLNSLSFVRTKALYVADGTLSNIDTKSTGVIKNSYVTVKTHSGELYSMNHSSAFARDLVPGQNVLLLKIGPNVELI